MITNVDSKTSLCPIPLCPIPYSALPLGRRTSDMLEIAAKALRAQGKYADKNESLIEKFIEYHDLGKRPISSDFFESILKINSSPNKKLKMTQHEINRYAELLGFELVWNGEELNLEASRAAAKKSAEMKTNLSPKFLIKPLFQTASRIAEIYVSTVNVLFPRFKIQKIREGVGTGFIRFLEEQKKISYFDFFKLLRGLDHAKQPDKKLSESMAKGFGYEIIWENGRVDFEKTHIKNGMLEGFDDTEITLENPEIYEELGATKEMIRLASKIAQILPQHEWGDPKNTQFINEETKRLLTSFLQFSDGIQEDYTLFFLTSLRLYECAVSKEFLNTFAKLSGWSLVWRPNGEPDYLATHKASGMIRANVQLERLEKLLYFSEPPKDILELYEEVEQTVPAENDEALDDVTAWRPDFLKLQGHFWITGECADFPNLKTWALDLQKYIPRKLLDRFMQSVGIRLCWDEDQTLSNIKTLRLNKELENQNTMF